MSHSPSTVPTILNILLLIPPTTCMEDLSLLHMKTQTLETFAPGFKLTNDRLRIETWDQTEKTHTPAEPLTTDFHKEMIGMEGKSKGWYFLKIF